MAWVFSADNGINGSEVWITNGTAAGTSLLRDIYGGPATSYPLYGFYSTGNQLLFSANDGIHGTEIWRTDGTAAGTSLVTDAILPGSATSIDYLSQSNAIALGDKRIFNAHNAAFEPQLWITDGTAAGTLLLRSNAGFPFISYGPVDYAILGGKSFFAIDDNVSGLEPWVTDGTAAGTFGLKDIVSGSGGSNASNFTTVGSHVVFSALSAEGYELWFTDGTQAGTQMLDVNTSGSWSSGAGQGGFAVVGSTGLAVFEADDGVHGSELWVTDGTIANTHMVADFAVGGDLGPNSFYAFGGKIVFENYQGPNGRQLWITDGTAAGTHEFTAIAQSGNGPYFFNPVTVGDKLFFTVLPSGNTTQFELWESDGTLAGSHFLKTFDTKPGWSAPDAYGFAPFGNKVVFAAYDAVHGRELWISDGTTAGTHILKDINFGTGDSNLGGFVQVGDALMFTADDGAHGTEFWVTDGTETGTHILTDINPGSAASTPRGFAYINMKPTGIALSALGVNEFRANGTVVGALSTTDLDIGDTYTYTLLNNAGGRFAISGSSVVVANGLLLDFEQAASHSVTIRTTDQGGKFFDKVMIIGVGDVNPEVLTGDVTNNTFLGGALGDTFNGWLGNDTLNGQGGADSLNGSAGNDTLIGGDGNDIYYVDSLADIITESNALLATGGTDTIYASVTRTLGLNVERLVLTGTTALNGAGNALNNIITGNGAANVLSGLAGNDTLNGAVGNDMLAGGLGNDTLAGGAGLDTFLFNTALSSAVNRDVISDFVAADDIMRLENAIFSGLGAVTGFLASAKFWASATGLAHDADDRIIYNTASGVLTYDSNGNAAGGTIAQFALLTTKPALTSADFLVI
ncbi:MAG: hypothetical protein ABL907_04520 [Hyphomicrobium sp.]